MQYVHWLILLSAAFLLLERLFPWRRGQPLLRPGLAQDVAFLALNGHLFGLWTQQLNRWFWGRTAGALESAGLPAAGQPMAGWPLWAQFLAFLLVADLLQWCIHNLLHRVPWLWQFHKVHHSITTMDWIGNFRFHWVEALVYKMLQAIPLALLGAEHDAAFWVYVLGTGWGHFNHANLNVGLGPLGYVFNSPRMHLWHHDISDEGGTAKNFAIVFSLWDWIFRTAYWPRDRNPERIGYPGMEEMPAHLAGKLLWPLTRRRAAADAQA